MLNEFFSYLSKAERVADMCSFASSYFQLCEEEEEDLFCTVYNFDLCEKSVEQYLLTKFDREFLIFEFQDDEELKLAREREWAKERLPPAFRAEDEDSDKDRLRSSALRMSLFQYNKNIKRWIPREKPRDLGNVFSDLSQRRAKFKSGLAKRASELASQRRIKERGKERNLKDEPDENKEMKSEIKSDLKDNKESE